MIHVPRRSHMTQLRPVQQNEYIFVKIQQSNSIVVVGTTTVFMILKLFLLVVIH